MPGFLLSSVLCFSLLLVLFPPASSAPSPVVITSNGPIQGKDIAVGPRSVTAYLGSRYAKPPVGILRFWEPQSLEPWNEVLEATSFGNACPQFIFTNSMEAHLWAANPPVS